MSENLLKKRINSNYLTIRENFLFTNGLKSGIVFFRNKKGEDSDHEENK